MTKEIKEAALGSRMKMYENIEADRRFIPLLPIMARMDGRAFHSFTKGLSRPFDGGFSQAMINATMELMRETNAIIGYTQSDEITLVWFSDDIKSQIWFNGRIVKMVAQLAAQATVSFYQAIENFHPRLTKKKPTFDARVWQMPNKEEVANNLLWRERDATKNSISMLASTYFAESELHRLSGKQKQELLFQKKQINWNSYPDAFKRGTYIRRQTHHRPFSAKERESLPPRHAAHTNPDLQIERTVFAVLPLPPLGSLANRVEIIFDGAAPITK